MPDVVNLPNIATQLGAALGVGDFGGGLLMTGITMALFIFPILMLCNKYRMDSTWPTMITGFIVLGFSIYAYSLPVWILLMEVLLVAIILANTMRNFVSKGG